MKQMIDPPALSEASVRDRRGAEVVVVSSMNLDARPLYHTTRPEPRQDVSKAMVERNGWNDSRKGW